MHYHIFPMGEENQVLGKNKIILDWAIHVAVLSF